MGYGERYFVIISPNVGDLRNYEPIMGIDLRMSIKGGHCMYTRNA